MLLPARRRALRVFSFRALEEKALLRDPQRDLSVGQDLHLDPGLPRNDRHFPEAHLRVGTYPNGPVVAHHFCRKVSVHVRKSPHVSREGDPPLPQDPKHPHVVDLERVRPGRGGGIDEALYMGHVLAPGRGGGGDVGFLPRGVKGAHRIGEQAEILRKVPLDPPAIGIAETYRVVGGKIGIREFPR